MSETVYELVFDGLLVDGVSYAQAQQNVLKLFKATPEQVAKMFQGGRIVLRNKLDRVSGDKYVAVLYKNGLMCRLEAMAAQPVKNAESSVKPGASVAAPVQTPKPKPELKKEPKKEPEKISRVDELLQHSSLKLAPVGVRLSEPVERETPVFSHQNEFEVSPVGVRMSDEEAVVPVAIGDISGISIAPTGTDMGQLKPKVKALNPDTSKIQLVE